MTAGSWSGGGFRMTCDQGTLLPPPLKEAGRSGLANSSAPQETKRENSLLVLDRHLLPCLVDKQALDVVLLSVLGLDSDDLLRRESSQARSTML